MAKDSKSGSRLHEATTQKTKVRKNMTTTKTTKSRAKSSTKKNAKNETIIQTITENDVQSALSTAIDQAIPMLDDDKLIHFAGRLIEKVTTCYFAYIDDEELVLPSKSTQFAVDLCRLSKNGDKLAKRMLEALRGRTTELANGTITKTGLGGYSAPVVNHLRKLEGKERIVSASGTTTRYADGDEQKIS